MPQATLQTGVGVAPCEGVADPPVGSPLQQMAAMRDEVRQLHRLTMLGTAAATIAHEFNNLLTPVMGYAKYSLDSGDVELMKKALQMTLRQSAIATAMSDRILGVAASETRTAQTIRARDVVDEAVACLEPAVAGHPDDARVHHLMGLVLDASGRPDDALAFCEQAAKLQPGGAVYQASYQTPGGSEEPGGELAPGAEPLPLPTPVPLPVDPEPSSPEA